MQARNFAQVAQLYRHHIDGFELVVLGLVGLSKHLFFELELLPVWISLVEHSYLSAGLRSSVLLADQVGNRTTTVSDARVPRYQLHHEDD